MRSFALAVITFISFSATSWAGDGDLREQFVREYEPHAVLLKQWYSNSRAKFKSYREPLPANAAQVAELVEGKLTADGHLLEGYAAKVDPQSRQTSYHDWAGVVEVRNLQYQFSLKKNGPTDPWTLTKIEMFEPDKRYPLSLLVVPYADQFRAMSYLEIAKDPKTQVLEVVNLTWHGKVVKEVIIQFPIIDRNTKQEVLAKQGYFFSPEEHWVCVGVRDYDSGPETKPTFYEKSFLYESDGANPPRLKRIEDWFRNRSDPETGKRFRVVEILEFEHVAPFAEEEFRLSKFGLPEPVGVVWKNPSSNYIWLLALAFGFGVMAIGFRWLARSRQSRSGSGT